MNDLKAKVPFDPEGFGLRSWFRADGHLFGDDFSLGMKLPKGGAKIAKWLVWYEAPPDVGQPFLVAFGEFGRFPAA